jgi:hypothetical protein
VRVLCVYPVCVIRVVCVSASVRECVVLCVLWYVVCVSMCARVWFVEFVTEHAKRRGRRWVLRTVGEVKKRRVRKQKHEHVS